jgi:hypothetical protein
MGGDEPRSFPEQAILAAPATQLSKPLCALNSRLVQPTEDEAKKFFPAQADCSEVPYVTDWQWDAVGRTASARRKEARLIRDDWTLVARVIGTLDKQRAAGG